MAKPKETAPLGPRRHCCPGCGAKGLIPGPKGGLSQNFYCEGCGQGWNFHVYEGSVLRVDPLGPTDPNLREAYKTGLLP